MKKHKVVQEIEDVNLNSEYCLIRTDNLERICELVFEHNDYMFKQVKTNFYRSISDYYTLERQLFLHDKDIIQKAYIETLSLISKLKDEAPNVENLYQKPSLLKKYLGTDKYK